MNTKVQHQHDWKSIAKGTYTQHHQECTCGAKQVIVIDEAPSEVTLTRTVNLPKTVTIDEEVKAILAKPLVGSLKK